MSATFNNSNVGDCGEVAYITKYTCNIDLNSICYIKGLGLRDEGSHCTSTLVYIEFADADG